MNRRKFIRDGASAGLAAGMVISSARNAGSQQMRQEGAMPGQESVASDMWSSTRVAKGKTSASAFLFWADSQERSFNAHPVYAPVQEVRVHVNEDDAGTENTGLSSLIAVSGGYRGYATSRTADEKKMHITVWESRDGLDWQPVALNQAPEGPLNRLWFEGIPGDQGRVGLPCVVPLRDGRWRMYLWKHRDGHLRFTVAESEDGLRWSVPDFARPALYHPSDGGLWKLAEGLSRDELVRQDMPEEAVLERKRLWSNDSASVCYNKHLDRYECYSVWLHPAIPDRRVDVDNAPGVHRLIQRRVSEDGLEWSDPDLVLVPDERDPWDLQFYFLNVRWHEDFMIGCLGHYRVEDQQQTMDTELVFSRNGAHWERPVRGAWIPRSSSDSGRSDTAGVYTCDWLDKGDRWLCPYTATPNPHNAGVVRLQMMGVQFAKNRMVGLGAGATAAGVLTPAVVCGFLRDHNRCLYPRLAACRAV